MSIKLIKLVSGEELIAKVEECVAALKLFDIAILVPIQVDDEGNTSIALMPWLPHADTEKGVDISNTHILCSLTPNKNIESQYRKATSGIITPDTDLEL